MTRQRGDNIHNTGTVLELAPLPAADIFDHVQSLLDQGLLSWTDPNRTLDDYREGPLVGVALPIKITSMTDRRLADNGNQPDDAADSA